MRGDDKSTWSGVLLVLTAGTVVAGILGALLAVPVGAGVWTATASPLGGVKSG